MLSRLVFAATALSGLALAQNYSTSGPISIVPDSVPLANRTTWCIDQHQNCPLVCGGHASVDNCNATTLTYQCTCADGSKPNISDYANMLPSLICQQWVIDCVTAAGNDLTQLTACRSVICGHQDPGKVKQQGGATPGSGSSSAAAPSMTPSSTSGGGNGGSKPTASSTGGGASATTSNAAIALNIARNYGTPLLAGGLFAVFGLAL